jgi:hypothetical protein
VIAASLVAIGVEAAVAPQPADAGAYFNDTEFTYKEYWADHSTFTGGCGYSEVAGNAFYAEPDSCLKEIDLEIPDNVDNAIAAVINVNLWRNRSSKSARFTINDGPQYRPAIGTNFSRTPFTATVPLTELTQGINSLKFQEATGPYHIHDVMIRVYYDDQNPIIPGPNSDVSPPSGSLTSVTAVGGPTIDPTVGGTLQVDGNQVVLTADATGAAYVEFHAYYDGFDEDNDGETKDWHNFLRNNFGPGGTEEKASGATIGHIGTDSTAPYEVTWNLPTVVNQSGVKFKIRAVDASGNAVEAPGGVSADFTLDRTYEVEAYTIPNFPDQALYFDGEFPQLAELEIDLPSDLGDMDRAILLGNYWNNPDLSINDNPPFSVFDGPEDTWDTSKRELDITQLRPGTNTLQWNYRPPGFGAMIEGPGPMIVIHRQPPAGAPIINESPEDVLVASGQAATMSVAASGEQVLSYQWRLDGNPIVGATSATYTTPALLPANDGSKYDVVVSNGQGSATSAEATVTLASIISSSAPWWDTQWDYRAPLTAFPESVARTDKVVEEAVNFSDLMAAAGSGGPTFDANSIRVIETDANGTIIGEVPFQFEPGSDYDPVSNAEGTLVWQLTGQTPAGQARYFHTYFDKTYKGIPAANVVSQIVRTDVIDQNFDAWQFDMSDGSSWYFHKSGGGFGTILDPANNDWISWNPAEGTQGDFRGLPNAVKPPAGYFHPGRGNKTDSTILFEGPLRITFESRARDNSWISVWSMYPDTAEFAMTRANTRFYVQYEGTPGGEVDANDQLTRSDGTVIPYDGEYEADLPGAEWMYLSDMTDGRSFFMAHHQNDGSVESYRLLNGEMPIAAFGRGGLNLNSPYLRKVIDGEPQTFTFGLADTVDMPNTSARILDAYTEVKVVTGAPDFAGTDSGAVSDDFSSATLNPFWMVSDPQGDTTFSLTGSTLLIDMPAGPSHDLWEGRDFAPRLLQAVGDEDLDVVAGFASVPTQQFQGQGLLFWQDANNWLRFTVEHDGTRAKAVAYKMVDGDASQVVKKNLPGIATRFLRTIRSGDTWTFQRSYNGTRWFDLPVANIPISLNAVGILGTAHGSTSPAYTVEVDYFESKTSGDLNDDAPQISNVAVTNDSHRAVVTWDTNVDADTRVDHGATTDLSERIIDETPTMSHSVTLDYLRCDTPYFFRPQSSTEIGTTVADMVSFQTDVCPPVRSDDFSTGSLMPFWTVFDPVGDVGVNLSDQNVVLSVPADSEHNLFTDENQAARLRQPGPIGDFEVEAKFETVLNKRFQVQGIVVEEDEDSYLRFEVHHDGNQLRTYAIGVLDNVPTTNFHYGVLPQSTDHYVRVNRTGNIWTMSHSPDGTTWTTVASLVVAIESIYVGPYIGNTSTGKASPPAVLGSIDYFFNTDAPIVPEDGGTGPDLTPPVITNIASVTESPTSQSATITWTTDEPATTRIDWGVTNSYGDGPLIENTATRNHSVVIEPVLCGTTYHYGVSSNDAAGNTGTGPNRTFTTQACPGGAFSDNFSDSSLDARWFVDDPRQDSTFLLDGDLLTLSVPPGVRHDLTPNNNGALRVLQAVPDTDFVVEAGFESPVDFNFQLQGLVFEQDDDNLVRFDLSNDGTGTKAFVGVLSANSLSAKSFATVPGAAPSHLRVTRVGTTWTFEYSPDRGNTWQTIWSGTINKSVARIGPFAGNANPQVANVPPHSALVDYFLSDFDPIPITGTGQNGPPSFVIFDGEGGLLAETDVLNFGSLGLAQPDINVRGRVTDADGIRSLTFAVNGSEPSLMGIGSTDCELGVSCTRRLVVDGDLNADVDASLLNPGLNTITLRAVDEEFNASTLDVLVNYTPGNDWPLPYSVDWSTVTDLYDVSQPVDGRWSITGNELQIEEIGYDRLIAFGDNSWSSFEAEVPITINSFDPEGYEAPSGGPGVGFIPHWRGHTQAEFTQPKYGFAGQVGALVWYRYRDDVNAERLEIRDSNATLVAEDLSGRTLTAGVTYTFKIQAETGGGDGPLYRLKVWPEGTSEPSDWDIVTALPPDAPDTGSLVLVAHHVDATYGNLDVRQITADAPTITPDSGSSVGLTKVEMFTDTRAGEIRYTTDGSEPTATSTLYDEPFFVTEALTIKARTFRDGFIDSSTTERVYSILPAPDRVSNGLEALYRFDEDGGTTVGDSSQVGTVHDLTIEPGADVTWLSDLDALRINGPSIIQTATGVNDINTNVQASQGVSVEMWIDPVTFDIGDATLFNLAPSTGGQQNLELSQDGRALEMSLRTVTTSSDGKPSLSSGGVLPPQLHQLVYVMRPDNTASVYIDGLKAWDGYRGGSLNAWAAGYGLSIANSGEGVNPWRGDMYLMAVYSSDLSQAEITQNYQSGPFPPPANYAPVATAGPDITLVQGEVAQMAAAASDDGNPIPPGTLTTSWTQVSGPDTAVFSDASSPTATVTLPAAGTYEFRWEGDDGEKTTADNMFIEVISAGSQAPPPSIDPPSGNYPGSVTVTMASTVPNAEVRYTTDGSDPTAASTLFTAPFDLTVSTTVKARTFRAGLGDSEVTTSSINITPDSRVTDDLVAFYPFNEPNGSSIKDKEGVALNLSIENVGRTTRVPSGLRIDQSTVIASTKAATKINNGVKASGEVTVEMWLEPSDIVQNNAMPFGISANPNARNVGMIQSGADLDVFLRTKATNSKGQPPTEANGSLQEEMIHLVFTRDSSGATTVYVDGVEVASGTVGNTLGNWVGNHRLHLAAERNGTRPWLGTYFLLAVYDRALTPSEVIQNFAFGDV